MATQVITQTQVMSIAALVGEPSDVQSPDVTTAKPVVEMAEAENRRFLAAVRCGVKNRRHAVAMEERDRLQAEIDGGVSAHQPSRSVMVTIAVGYCPTGCGATENKPVAAPQPENPDSQADGWLRRIVHQIGGVVFTRGGGWDSLTSELRENVVTHKMTVEAAMSLFTMRRRETNERLSSKIAETENNIRSRNLRARDGLAKNGRDYRAAWLARGFRTSEQADKSHPDWIPRPSEPDRRWLDTMSDSAKKKMAEQNAKACERWAKKGEKTITVPGVHTIPDINVWRPGFEAYCVFMAKKWAHLNGFGGSEIVRGTKTRSRPKNNIATVNGKKVRQRIREVKREQSEYIGEVFAELIVLQLLAKLGNRPFGFGPGIRLARALNHQRGIDRANRHHLAILHLRNGLIASGADGETIDSARNSALNNVAKAIVAGTASAPKDGKPSQKQWLVGQGINSVGSTESKRANAPKSEYVPTDPRLADRLREMQLTSRNEDVAAAVLECMELIADQRLTEKQRQFLAEFRDCDCSPTDWAKRYGGSVGSVAQYIDTIRARIADPGDDLVAKLRRDKIGEILRNAGEGTTIRGHVSRTPQLEGRQKGFAQASFSARLA